MSAPGDAYNISLFIKAKSAKKLEELMLKNNLSKGTQFQYHSIQNVNGTWYAWYVDSVKYRVKKEN